MNQQQVFEYCPRAGREPFFWIGDSGNPSATVLAKLLGAMGLDDGGFQCSQPVGLEFHFCLPATVYECR